MLTSDDLDVWSSFKHFNPQVLTYWSVFYVS